MKLLRQFFFFSGMKLKHKLILIIAVVSAVISGFIALGFIYVIQQYNKLLYTQTANSLSFFFEEITYQTQRVEDLSSYITYDAVFQSNLQIFNRSSWSSLTAQKARTEIMAILYRYYTSDITQITVMPENNRSFWWGKTELSETEKDMEMLLKACDDANGRVVWFPSQNGSHILCARRILTVENLDLSPMGYLILEIDLGDTVESLMKSGHISDHQFQIFISTDTKLVYPADSEAYIQYYDELFAGQSPYAIRKIDKQRMFITFLKLPLGRDMWHISLAVPYDDIFHSLNNLLYAFLFSLTLAVCISASLAGNIVKSISAQFNTLLRKMDRIKQEGIMGPVVTSPSPSNSHDEMVILNATFDQMIVEIKKLIEESYVKQLLITQAELKALEQQVNPHFLYNTLNTVNWLAKRAGAKEISIIAESLGGIFQNTLSNGQTVIPLKKELEIVSCYMNIQKIRFEELVVVYDIDESVLDTEIPKMTIQPLMDNAIIYSQQEPQGIYLVRLSIRKKELLSSECCVEVQVQNSGSHIDVDILKHLKDKTVLPSGNGIGLLNIDSRLRIIFGEQYHLYFSNMDNMTTVSFNIPYMVREEVISCTNS